MHELVFNLKQCILKKTNDLFTESDYADVLGENQGSSGDLEINVDFREDRSDPEASPANTTLLPGHCDIGEEISMSTKGKNK